MMTETLVGVSPRRKAAEKALAPEEVERAAVRELVKAASARGEELTGPDGLLKAITKQVIEAALEEEMNEHVGYDKHAVEGRHGADSRNGTRTKTVLTDNAGPVQVEVPRDREASFEPVIVKKRQRRLTDVDALVLSLYAVGLTTLACPRRVKHPSACADTPSLPPATRTRVGMLHTPPRSIRRVLAMKGLPPSRHLKAYVSPPMSKPRMCRSLNVGR